MVADTRGRYLHTRPGMKKEVVHIVCVWLLEDAVKPNLNSSWPRLVSTLVTPT